jgi:hypothetical protein
MRAIVVGAIVLGFAVSPALARPGGAGDKAGTSLAATSSASSSNIPSSDPTAVSKADSPAKPAEAGMESELQELRDLIETQSKQIQVESEALKEQQQQMQTLENRLKMASAASENLAAAPAGSAMPVSSPMALNATSPNIAAAPEALARAQKPADDEPQSLRFKGITLTPGGYFAAETVWRNRAVGSDINSAFNNVPLPGNDQSHLTEFNASGRQSRIAMLAQGKLKNITIGGYYEMDFLSAGVTSNDNQSNSYTLRQRQFWAQAKFNSGWTVTGGQMWSLVTETKAGLDNRSEATTQTIDAQYNVGFSWARQYGFRVAKSFGDKFWLGASVEEAQTTVTVHGQNASTNFLVGSYGIGAGLYNATANYAFSASPDFVVKAAWQPKGWGHYEIFGILTTPRDRVYPCAQVLAGVSCGGVSGPSGAGAFNDTRSGGGVGANARARFFKHVDLGVHVFAGDGIGRYGSVGLPQATIRPNGTIAPIRNYQSLGTIEYFSNKLDVYAYLGDEYESRAGYATSATTAVGYGSPLFANSGCWSEPAPTASGSITGTSNGVSGAVGFVPGSLSNCTNDTKHEMEGTLGFWYRFYKGSKGTVQFGMQESYFLRYDWNGVGNKTGVGAGISGAPHGTDNMVFTSFRYVLP